MRGAGHALTASVVVLLVTGYWDMGKTFGCGKFGRPGSEWEPTGLMYGAGDIGSGCEQEFWQDLEGATAAAT